MTLKDNLLLSFKWAAESQAKLHQVYIAAEDLELLDGAEDCYYDFSVYSDRPSIRLVCYSTFHKTAAEVMAAKAKALLPKLGQLVKGFDETSNHIKLTAEYNGVEIIIEAKPPKTCIVETVTEDVEVPEQLIPARKETRTRFVLKGDCDPLLDTSNGVVDAEAEQAMYNNQEVL